MPSFADARSLSLSLSLSLCSSIASRYNPSASLYGIPLFKECRFSILPSKIKHSTLPNEKAGMRKTHRWSFCYPQSGENTFLLSETGKGTNRNASGTANFSQEEHS